MNMKLYTLPDCLLELPRNEIEHISFSALKTFNRCPYAYMLDYIYEIDKFSGNVHTFFGSSIHETIETRYSNIGKHDSRALFKIFENKFIEHSKEHVEQALIDQKEMKDFNAQGGKILNNVFDAVDKQFGKGWKIYSIEEELYEDIENSNLKYKGYIDFVVELPNGKYVIIDWKTCSWGWNAEKKRDFYGVLMQLTLYKFYWARKHNIDYKLITTMFSLLKRTAKEDKNVEFFKTYNGPKSIDKATKSVRNMVYGISNDLFPQKKIEKNCKYCQYRNTQYCV